MSGPLMARQRFEVVGDRSSATPFADAASGVREVWLKRARVAVEAWEGEA